MHPLAPAHSQKILLPVKHPSMHAQHCDTFHSLQRMTRVGGTPTQLAAAERSYRVASYRDHVLTRCRCVWVCSARGR